MIAVKIVLAAAPDTDPLNSIVASQRDTCYLSQKCPELQYLKCSDGATKGPRVSKHRRRNQGIMRRQFAQSIGAQVEAQKCLQ